MVALVYEEGRHSWDFSDLREVYNRSRRAALAGIGVVEERARR